MADHEACITNDCIYIHAYATKKQLKKKQSIVGHVMEGSWAVDRIGRGKGGGGSRYLRGYSCQAPQLVAFFMTHTKSLLIRGLAAVFCT